MGLGARGSLQHPSCLTAEQGQPSCLALTREDLNQLSNQLFIIKMTSVASDLLKGCSSWWRNELMKNT